MPPVLNSLLSGKKIMSVRPSVKILGVFVLVAGIATAVLAQPLNDAALTQQVRSILQNFGVQAEPSAINDTGVANLKEVIIDGEVFYVTSDGKHFFLGNLLAIEANGMTNLTEQTKNGLRRDAIATVNENDMLIYGEADLKHTITVFTDANCPYCASFHQQVPALNKTGIRVRYLFLPVIRPTSYEDAKAVWCAQDRHAAFDQAIAGTPAVSADCAHPLDAHLELGRKLGINATPTVVLSDGNVLMQQLTAQQLAQLLEEAGL